MGRGKIAKFANLGGYGCSRVMVNLGYLFARKGSKVNCYIRCSCNVRGRGRRDGHKSDVKRIGYTPLPPRGFRCAMAFFYWLPAQKKSP